MPLFVRITKSVAFTSEGKELFSTVAKAFSILDNGITQLQERVNQAYESFEYCCYRYTIGRHFLLPYSLTKWQLQENQIGLHIINMRPSPDCVWNGSFNKEVQLAVVNQLRVCVAIHN